MISKLLIKNWKGDEKEMTIVDEEAFYRVLYVIEVLLVLVSIGLLYHTRFSLSEKRLFRKVDKLSNYKHLSNKRIVSILKVIYRILDERNVSFFKQEPWARKYPSEWMNCRYNLEYCLSEPDYLNNNLEKISEETINYFKYPYKNPKDLILDKLDYLRSKKNYLSIERIHEILMDIKKLLVDVWNDWPIVVNGKRESSRWVRCEDYLLRLDPKTDLPKRADCKKVIDRIYKILYY